MRVLGFLAEKIQLRVSDGFWLCFQRPERRSKGIISILVVELTLDGDFQICVVNDRNVKYIAS